MSEILAMLIILAVFHLFHLSELAVETNFLSGMFKEITILLISSESNDTVVLIIETLKLFLVSLKIDLGMYLLS